LARSGRPSRGIFRTHAFEANAVCRGRGTGILFDARVLPSDYLSRTAIRARLARSVVAIRYVSRMRGPAMTPQQEVGRRYRFGGYNREQGET
jgi:hypothetical protein